MPTKKNPVPKIGRKYKSGYQEKEFKPSKKLLKSLGVTEQQFRQRQQQRLKRAVQRLEQQKYRTQYERTQLYREQLLESARTFAPEAVFGKPKDWYEQYQDNLQRLGDLVKSGQYTGQFLGIDDLPRGNVIDRITVLTNILGLENAADILNTNEDLLTIAFEGTRLNRLQDDELNEGYSHLSRDRDLQDDFNIDIDYVEREAAVLREALRFIDNVDSVLIFRNAVADGDVSLEKLEKNYDLFGNLTSGQLGKILDAWVENHAGGLTTSRMFDLDEMFDAFAEDGNDFWNLEESEFWAWFRELFY